jgi:SAM-dependent methyltransferase
MKGADAPQYSRCVAEHALTDAAHWSEYWRSRRPEEVPERWYYADLLRATVGGRGYSSFLELGGFPGSFAIYARRYLGFADVALLDAFVDRAHLAAALTVNGLEPEDVEVFEGDMFEFELPRTYDVVLSGGLVEHFADPADALERHTRWVSPGGVVIVTVPNFRGLNGEVQRRLNPENLELHNRDVMVPGTLADALAAAGDFASVESFYYGPFRAWLEPGASIFARTVLHGVRVLGFALDALRPRSRLTGRDVVAVGRKR